MRIHSKIIRKVFATLALALGLFAVALQFWIVIKNVPSTGLSYASEIIRFFSYMTILSNILVIIFFIFQLSSSKTGVAEFFKSHSVSSAIFLYIFIVAFVNYVALAGLYQFTGHQLLADKLLHYIMPAVYIIYWIFILPKAALPYKHIFYWVLFPLVYVIYILIRGTVSHLYPYPFLDVVIYGYPRVLINMLMITAAYFFSGVALIFINNRMLVSREPITL